MNVSETVSTAASPTPDSGYDDSAFDGHGRSLRVAHLLGGREGGGITTAIASLLSGLDRRRVQPSIVILRSKPGPGDHKFLPYNPCYMQKRRGGIATIVKIARYCRRQHIGILHTHSISSNLYGRLAGLLSPRTTVVTTVHARTEDELRGALGNARLESCVAHLDLRMQRLTWRFIAVSDWLKEELIARGVPARKIHSVPHGIQFCRAGVDVGEVDSVRRALKIQGDSQVVGIVGRLTRVKNHALFLRAARRLLSRNPAVTLLIVGDGPLRAELKTQAEDLGIAKNTIFVGWVDNIHPYLHLMDVLVSSSVSEGFGYAVLEAMACGKPVVATCVSEMPNIIDDGETGVLTPPTDPDALARAVARLLGDSGLRDRIGRAAQHKATAFFSLEQEAERHVEIYRRVLGGRCA